MGSGFLGIPTIQLPPEMPLGTRVKASLLKALKGVLHVFCWQFEASHLKVIYGFLLVSFQHKQSPHLLEATFIFSGFETDN